MTEQTKQLIRQHLKDYLLKITTCEKGNIYKNPFNKGGQEETGSLHYYDESLTCYDFVNNESYDIFALYGKCNGLDTKKDFLKISKELANIFNIIIDNEPQQRTPHKIQEELKQEKKELKDYTEYYAKCKEELKKNAAAKEYLTHRKIYNTELIEKYNIGYDEKNKQIVIPCNPYYYKIRKIDPQPNENPHNNHLQAPTDLWNSKELENSTATTCIYITESITDSISILTADPSKKTIALNSTSNYKKLTENITKYKYNGFLILALDTDTSGITTSKKIKEELEAKGTYCYIMNNEPQEYFEEAKDLNECLIKTNTDTLKIMLDEAENEAREKSKKFILKDLQPTSDYIAILEEQIKNQEYKPAPTTIPIIDKVLNGGLYPKQIITITADTSIGKTAFALQLADIIAEQKPVLYFSLEMSQSELISRSISRYMFIDPNNPFTNSKIDTTFTQTDILNGKQYKNIDNINRFESAKNRYIEQVKDNLIIYECTEDNSIKKITDTIEAYINKTRLKPVVFIDYLQYIRADIKGTDKQEADIIIRELKRVARQQKINIIIISSTARNNYDTEITLASSKNSGDIEYTADIVLGLELSILSTIKGNKEYYTKNGGYTAKGKDEIKKARKGDPNEYYRKDITIKILKNRNGKRDIDITNIKFYPPANYFDFCEAAEN